MPFTVTVKYVPHTCYPLTLTIHYPDGALSTFKWGISACYRLDLSRGVLDIAVDLLNEHLSYHSPPGDDAGTLVEGWCKTNLLQLISR